MKKLSLVQKRELKGIIFVLPFVFGMLFFLIIPLIQSLQFSFGDIALDGETGRYAFTFKGLVNYDKAFTKDLNFIRLILNSLQELASKVPFIVIVSFLIASLLKKDFKGRGIYRLLFFMPVILTAGILPGIDSGDVLQGLIGSGTVVDHTAVNDLTSLINTDLLTDSLSSMKINPAFIDYITQAVGSIIVIINSCGIQFLIFLAALQTISSSIYEAAEVEGATSWQVFWKITIPMISPQILIVVVYTIIDSFVNLNNSFMQYINSLGFTKLETGYAAALSWLYFALVTFVVGLVYFAISRVVFYNNNER